MNKYRSVIGFAGISENKTIAWSQLIIRNSIIGALIYAPLLVIATIVFRYFFAASDLATLGLMFSFVALYAATIGRQVLNMAENYVESPE